MIRITAAACLTWPRVLAWRLRHQYLDHRATQGEALSMVRQICGLHAQVMSSAELTLWARVDDLEPDAVQEALWKERSLVKTWAMRGTLHLLPASELPIWVGAQGVLKPRHHAPSWLRYFGLTREEAESLIAAIPDALADRMLTREELAQEVGRLVGSEPVDTEEAAREITRRYLGAYGPATREEFARWFGTASPARAGRLIEGLGEEVASVEIEGSQAWMLAEHLPELEATEPSGVVRLLPAFDHYVVAAPRNREAVLPEALKRRVYRSQGWLSPVLLVDGRMDGVWRHERKGGRLIVDIEPFAKQPEWVRRATEEEAEQLSRFLGGELELTWSSS